jgi:hypothetical protein
MAALPGVEFAIIDERKITGYLLSETHPRGRAKAAFFLRFGFQQNFPEPMVKALLDHALRHQIAGSVETRFGIHYIIEGTMHTPDKRNPLIRSVWVIKTGETVPRFVTATPIRKKSSK